MNICLFSASMLTLVLVLAHSILGEMKIFQKTNGNELPVIKGMPMMWHTDAFTYRTIRFIWHIASILGIAIVIILAYFSFLPAIGRNEAFVINVYSYCMLTSGIIAMLLSKGTHMGWVLFILVWVLIIFS